MAMIPAKCTNCGANIHVDDLKEAGICEACGTAFITEKVINNYNTTNNYHADVVNVYNATNEDFEIEAGVLVRYKGSADELAIPEHVKIIGKNAFANLSGLIGVIIPESVHTIEDFAFSNCKSLSKVSLPTSIKKIPASCFSGCEKLRSIDIPLGCLTIECFAFHSCTNLLHISLPNSLQDIQESAFENCKSLEHIKIPASVRTIQGHGNKYFESTKTFNTVKSCFSGCHSLNSVTFEGNETQIYCSPYLGLFDNNANSVNVIAAETWKKQNESKINKVSKKGCYVATYVYGSYDCPQVWTLRRYRDDTLGSTWHGRLFIRAYYAISPTLVKWFGNTQWFKNFWKNKLDKMVYNLRSSGIDDTPYQDKDWR